LLFAAPGARFVLGLVGAPISRISARLISPAHLACVPPVFLAR
jgi:hypothetical protein